jgi:hypothetical protein
MILEVEVFESLEGLANDIQEATKSHPDNVYSKELPMKIEAEKKVFDKIEEALKVRASYDGLRHESHLMSNTWQMGDTYVSFLIKK